METKSPFYIVQEFVCEELIDACAFTVPDVDKEGHYVETIKTSDHAEELIYNRLVSILPDIEAYYNIQHKGTERVVFEWFPEGSKGKFICENSAFLRGKWLRTKQRDLTAILFLSDYRDVPQFDDYEVYGGKLEFVQHKFGFNPQRGTLIVFPSDPHFINITTPIVVGDLYQARMQIAAAVPYLYDPLQFTGNYLSWFKPLLER
jgi:hypothetical protein